ncbi:MAG: anhydro-N-acetylmuramic acid kinase [Phycisphaerales bacterium]|nr:anhydro-N-acetylmuramic acid kinase [Phycisphaerales bacterium]
MSTRIVIGCMTGTSIDGIDAAAVRMTGRGLGLRVEFLAGVSRPLGPMAETLRRLARGEALTAEEIARAARDFSLEHAEAVRELAEEHAPAFVAVHGQTVFHAPPLSWQLFNAAPLAAAVGVPVVSDFRSADIAAGGQGAPITPLADFLCFADAGERRVIVNLGGFANFTALPRRTADAAADVEAIAGGDLCVCNQLLDRLARQFLGRDFDSGGAVAAAGRPIGPLVAELVERLTRQAGLGRSLGSADEPHAWEIEPTAGASAAADVLASATAAIGQVVAERLPACERVLLAGGGALNAALRAAIARHVAAPVELTDAYGLPGRYREAAQMAVLGALCADRAPITLPRVTGVARPAPVAGCWTGGCGNLADSIGDPA